MSQKNPEPPRWPDRFLSWYCNDAVREQVQGDAHELFYWRVEDKGLSKARRAFTWDVLRLFKWSNIKRTSPQKQQLNNIAMFKNYFKIGLRNLWKQRMPSTINVVGLSLAIGCCLVAFKFVESSLLKDRFHENGDRIYMATHTAFVDNETNQYGYLSVEVSDLMRENFPEIKRVLRYSSRGILVTKGRDKLFAHAIFTDEGFFDSFSFPITHGDKDALNNPRNVVITKSKAAQFFGEEDPLGQVITLDFNDEERDFIVAAVCEDSPLKSTLRLGVIVNHVMLREDSEPKNFNSGVFIEVDDRANIGILRTKLQALATDQRALDRNRKYDAIGMVPLASLGSTANEIRDGIGNAPPMAPIILLSCIALFMLTLATFNYINIATLMATKRIKEIGVRKVIGGRKSQLIVQFLTENLMLCTLAVGIGCLLAAGFFLPQFSLIAGEAFTLDLLEDQQLWLFLGGLLLFITLVSGAYPAFLASTFEPVRIFRGGEKVGGKRRFMGFLLSFQFTLAIITIIAGIMFVHTNQVNEKRDWGYDQHDKLVVGLGPQIYPEMRDKALKDPNVIAVAGSSGTVGKSYINAKATIGEQERYTEILKGDFQYAQLLGLKLKNGRYFDAAFQSDVQSSIMVNETFMNQFGLDFSEDHLVRIDSVNYQIVGVLEDFHYHAFDERIQPAVLRAIPDSEVAHMTVQVNPGTLSAVEASLRKVWQEAVEEDEFNSYRQSEVFDGHFNDVRGVRNIILFTATLAVILSAMGLFGLVSLSVSSRLKDFGVKKILGASMLQLSRDIYGKFKWILGFAIVLGSTLAAFVIGMLLDSAYGYHEPMNIFTLILAAIILLTIAGVTISSQIRKMSRMNPAETLRTE